MDNMNMNNGVQNGQFDQNMQQGQQMQFMPQPAAAHQNVQNVQATPVNASVAMNITSMADLQSYAAGIVVRFPDFAEGQPFVARVRRPSLLVLAKQGKIPNTLLTAAGELFNNGGAGSKADDDTLGDMYDICKIVCEACLIQPTMQEIENAGIEITDEQLMAIFNYSQVGVKALVNFRQE